MKLWGELVATLSGSQIAYCIFESHNTCKTSASQKQQTSCGLQKSIKSDEGDEGVNFDTGGNCILSQPMVGDTIESDMMLNW